jgi:hypothetical protein
MTPSEQEVLAYIHDILQTGEGGISETEAESFREALGNPPCSRCGECCQEITCLLSVAFFGEDVTECPWLSFDARGQASCEFIALALQKGGEAVGIARAIIDFEFGCPKR